MQTIPLPTDTAFFSQRVELEGTSYILDFSWNERNKLWKLSVFTADGDPLVRGVSLVSNRSLLRRYKSKEGFPPGDLMMLDPTHTIDRADYGQLGTDVSLTYYLAEEVGD